MIARRLGACLLFPLLAACGAAPSPGVASPHQEPASELGVAPGDAPGAAAPSDESAVAKPKAREDGEGGSSSVTGAAVVSEPLGGSLSQAEIRGVVLKHAELFDPCYTLGAGKSQQFVATVTVKATLGPSGTVNTAEVIKTTAKNKKVDNCVVDAFRKIKFPAPKGGATSVITFPMEFEGAEEVR